MKIFRNGSSRLASLGPLLCSVFILFHLRARTLDSSKQFRVALSECDKLTTSLSKLKPTYDFATFAFTDNAGGRWTLENCRRSLRLTYSSLVNSQAEFPRLHVFTNDLSVAPQSTFKNESVDIVAHYFDPARLPKNSYSGKSPWKTLSRSKLDFVERLIKTLQKQIIWIDLDTLVFIDLGVPRRVPWVIGYQNGGCDGARNCSWEHTAKGGKFDRDIDPKFDALGDLWSLDLRAICAIREYEKMHLSEGLPLPEYDLQGFFTIMLQDFSLPVFMLHDLINYNFGFFCSNFKHPSATNMELRAVDGCLSCPRRGNVDMSEAVGAISFTAPTFQSLLLKSDALNLAWVTDISAQRWLTRWFLERDFPSTSC